MIEELEIELPIIEIQRKIVAVLDDIQKKIQYNSNINKNLAPYPYAARIAAQAA